MWMHMVPIEHVHSSSNLKNYYRVQKFHPVLGNCSTLHTKQSEKKYLRVREKKNGHVILTLETWCFNHSVLSSNLTHARSKVSNVSKIILQITQLMDNQGLCHTYINLQVIPNINWSNSQCALKSDLPIWFNWMNIINLIVFKLIQCSQFAMIEPDRSHLLWGV